MTFKALFQEEKRIRDQINKEDNLIANKVLEEYFENIGVANHIISQKLNGINALLSHYFLVKGTQEGILLENIMKKYNFNYSTVIRSAIIHLFGRDCELDSKLDPIKFPGVMSVKKFDDNYQLETVLGNITVTKASSLFRDTSSHYVFYNHLVGECFKRSYDFAKASIENCQVVLSYIPNVFYAGHYHAYLELESGVLDIASNSFYLSKEDSSRVLEGRIIKKLTYSEIEEKHTFLEERYPELKDTKYNKLLKLSLYYDFKDRL